MQHAFLISHVIAATLWVGGVFMASVIDWPTARHAMPNGKFPFRYVVGHGRRIFPAVYSAILILLASSIALVFVAPPTSGVETALLAAKATALLIMTGFTVYGTMVTWPRLQLATHQEAFTAYRIYILRAYVTLACGLVATVLGTVLGHFSA